MSTSIHTKGVINAKKLFEQQNHQKSFYINGAKLQIF